MNRAPHDYNWGSSKKRYEWKDEYLQQGFAPRDEALEKDLFGEQSHVHTGLNFNKYSSIPVRITGDNPPPGFEKVCIQLNLVWNGVPTCL